MSKADLVTSSTALAMQDPRVAAATERVFEIASRRDAALVESGARMLALVEAFIDEHLPEIASLRGSENARDRIAYEAATGLASACLMEQGRPRRGGN